MKLEDAQFESDQGRLYLAIKIDGTQAHVPRQDAKPMFFAGYVFVPGFEGVFPEVNFEIEPGRIIQLNGFTNDRRIWKLSKILFDISNRPPDFSKLGPVEIPTD